MRRVGLVLVALAGLVGCHGRSGPPSDPSVARVDEAGAVVKRGAIGASDQHAATYALVDVGNSSARDQSIDVEGTLVDAAGAPVGHLGTDRLRVPAGGTRTFALVSAVEAPAVAARFHVLRAVPVDDPAEVQVSGEAVTHGDLTVITATVKNTVERNGTAVVIASFHDAAGHILARPFSAVELEAGQSRVVRFEGPPTATAAVIFVGEVAFR